jgi:hypothetical protein
MIVGDPSLTLQYMYDSEYLLGICIVQLESLMHHRESMRLEDRMSVICASSACTFLYDIH